MKVLVACEYSGVVRDAFRAKGHRLPKWYSDNTDTKNRSRTFQGIAQAMAAQWSEDLSDSQPDPRGQ